MEKPFKIKSVSIPLIGDKYLQENYDNEGLNRFIDRIIATGADTASLIVNFVLPKPNSISYDSTLTDTHNPSNAEIASFA